MKIKSRTFNCYDWDDNIIYMPTNIVLFHKENNEEVFLTTEQFAHYRSLIGRNKNFYINKNNHFSEEGEKRNFKNYEIRGDSHGKKSSFREFRDCENEYFIKHLEEALEDKDFAPEWNHFVETLNCKIKSKNTFIITARGHSPETIYEGLKLLKKKKIIKYLIPKKNIYPVSYLNTDNAYGPQEFKFRVIEDIILKANNMGKSKVYFSDDDHKTYNHIKESIKKIQKELCHQVEIILKYTGTKEIEEALFKQVC